MAVAVSSAPTVKLLRANERNDVGPVLREIEAVNKRLDAFVKE